MTSGARERLVYSDAEIERILTEVKVVAMVGASPNEARPSYFVMKYLKAKGFRVIPVNPGQAGKTILGEPCFAELAAIPEPIDMVDIFRASEAVPGIVETALQLSPRPKVIWMQLAVRHDEAAETARAAGLTVVMDRCPKIEYARLSGEIGWNGINSRTISSKKQTMQKGYQNLSIRQPKLR